MSTALEIKDEHPDNARPSEAAIREALFLRGSLPDEEADDLRAHTRQLRENWR